MVLLIGKKFKIISGGITSNAEIIDLEDKYAIVSIEGTIYKMDKEKLKNKFETYEQRINSQFVKKCENCMEYKSGNCIGKKEICDDYRPSPTILKEEKDRWPKNGSVSRTKSDKFIIREYDDMYNKYHEVYH